MVKNNGPVDSNDFSVNVYSQNLGNITAPGANQVGGPTTIWKVQGLGAGQTA